MGAGQAMRRGHVVRAPHAERSRLGEPVRAVLLTFASLEMTPAHLLVRAVLLALTLTLKPY